MTLSLASVLERGGKREARRALAGHRRNGRETQVAVQLDLLAEVAQRYLDLVAAQADTRIAAEDLEQRERTVGAATRRVQAGASPESVQLAAEAMRARAAMDAARTDASVGAAWRRLQALWGTPATEAVPETIPDPLSLPVIPEYAALQALLERNPELRRLADEGRIREARLRLADAASTPDIDWQLGVRRLEAQDSWAMVAGASHGAGKPGSRRARNARGARRAGCTGVRA